MCDVTIHIDTWRMWYVTHSHNSFTQTPSQKYVTWLIHIDMWMSQVTYLCEWVCVNESHITYTNKSRHTHICMSRVISICGPLWRDSSICDMCEWVMWMSHVTHIRTSHVTHTYGWVASHVSHVKWCESCEVMRLKSSDAPQVKDSFMCYRHSFICVSQTLIHDVPQVMCQVMWHHLMRLKSCQVMRREAGGWGRVPFSWLEAGVEYHFHDLRHAYVCMSSVGFRV